MGKTTMTERMVKLETKVEAIQKQIELKHTEQRDDFKTVFKKLDNLEGKFAGKWTEKILIGLLITLVVAIIIMVVKESIGGA